MNFLTIIKEPTIILITSVFICFIITVITNYNRAEKNLKKAE